MAPFWKTRTEGRLLVVVKLGDGHQRLDRYDRRHTPWRREASIGNVAFVRADPAEYRRLRRLFRRS